MQKDPYNLRKSLIYKANSFLDNSKPSAILVDSMRIFGAGIPTTIFSSGFYEIYGINPDSTALMISTTSSITSRYLEGVSI
jgi:hypothetical protein